ncbi:MAG: VPDSG-CTERM sorting domain-containing protein [Verrucomicrobiales bacterium]
MIPAAILAATLPLPMAAETFEFYKLNDPSDAADFRPDGVSGVDYFPATGADLASSNVDGGILNGDLSYTSGSLTATATATYFGGDAAVVQDHEPNWTEARGAGLGVYHRSGDNSDDNITDGEKLTINFGESVNVTSIGLRAEGHSYAVGSWLPGATFLLNGVSTLLPSGTGSIAVDITGSELTFEYGGTTPDQFYLAVLEARSVSVPDGGASAALLGFSLLGLGFVRKQLASQ